jgi:hypothetical protein
MLKRLHNKPATTRRKSPLCEGLCTTEENAGRRLKTSMFDGFIRKQIKTQETTINLVLGGSGYPILLLHGYPQTHVCWHRVAPILAERFTVGRSKQIGKAIALIRGEIILVGHSFPKVRFKKRLLGFFLSQHRFGAVKKIGKKVLSCKNIFPINCQKTFRFFSTIAAMTRRFHLPTSHFMRKSCRMQPSAK